MICKLFIVRKINFKGEQHHDRTQRARTHRLPINRQAMA